MTEASHPQRRNQGRIPRLVLSQQTRLNSTGLESMRNRLLTLINPLAEDAARARLFFGDDPPEYILLNEFVEDVSASAHAASPMTFLPNTLGSDHELPPLSAQLVADFVSHYDSFIGRSAVLQDGRIACLVRLDSKRLHGHDVYYCFTEMAICAITKWSPPAVQFAEERMNPDGILVSLHNAASQFFDSYWLIASTYTATHFLFDDNVTERFAARDPTWFETYLDLRQRFERSLRQYQTAHGEAWFQQSLRELRAGRSL